MRSYGISRLISMTGKVSIFLVVVLLVFNFSQKDGKTFMELPSIELVHAESRAYDDAASEAEDEAVKEKEKIIEEFIKSLKEREKTLDLREKELDVRDANLESVKRDIEKRLEELRLVKAGIEKALDEQKAVNDANFTKLAKVYESTEPEKAGPMLSGLDVEISAQIILKMNNKKAGKLWGFVNPGKAILISNELTKYNDLSLRVRQENSE